MYNEDLIDFMTNERGWTWDSGLKTFFYQGFKSQLPYDVAIDFWKQGGKSYLSSKVDELESYAVQRDTF